MADGVFLGFQHNGAQRGDPEDQLHDPRRLLREQRLVVADHAADGRAARSRRKLNVPREHAVRHVPGRDRALAQQRLDGRAGLGRGRRASRRRTPPATSPARRSSAAPTSPPPSPTSSTTTARSSARTDWAWRAESGDWRFFFYDVPKAPAGRDGVPGRHDLGRRGAVHRSRHADLRAARRTSTSCSAAAPRSARRTSSTRSARARTRNIGAGVWTFDTATGGAREVSPRRRRRACTRSSSTRSAGRATSSTCRSRASSARRR